MTEEDIQELERFAERRGKRDVFERIMREEILERIAKQALVLLYAPNPYTTTLLGASLYQIGLKQEDALRIAKELAHKGLN